MGKNILMETGADEMTIASGLIRRRWGSAHKCARSRFGGVGCVCVEMPTGWQRMGIMENELLQSVDCAPGTVRLAVSPPLPILESGLPCGTGQTTPERRRRISAAEGGTWESGDTAEVRVFSEGNKRRPHNARIGLHFWWEDGKVQERRCHGDVTADPAVGRARTVGLGGESRDFRSRDPQQGRGSFFPSLFLLLVTRKEFS